MTYATTISASIVLRFLLSTAAEFLPAAVLAVASARTCGYFGTQVGTGIISYFALQKTWGKRPAPKASSGGGSSGLV
jgi:hypothetical protein